jgi:hypothetical protein
MPAVNTSEWLMECTMWSRSDHSVVSDSERFSSTISFHLLRYGVIMYRRRDR